MINRKYVLMNALFSILHNPNTEFISCPCHIIHNTTSFAAKAYYEATGFYLEDLAVDLFYYFDHSSKKKANLQDIVICSYVSTRWLSVELVVQRILKFYNGLVSMFKSESESTPRFKKFSPNL